jgi:hypothetical protein
MKEIMKKKEERKNEKREGRKQTVDGGGEEEGTDGLDDHLIVRVRQQQLHNDSNLSRVRGKTTQTEPEGDQKQGNERRTE